MPHRNEVDVDVTVTAVKRPSVILDRWDDPGGHAAAEAGHPVPSYTFLALDDPGEITVPVAYLMEQVRDELVDIPHAYCEYDDVSALWAEFELLPVLPAEKGELEFRLFHRPDLKDYEPAVKRARFHEQALQRAEHVLTRAEGYVARGAAINVLRKAAIQASRLLWELASGAPL